MLQRILLLASIAILARAQDTGRMDQIVQSYATAKTFMGSVLVAHGGDVLFNKGYGMANLEWDIPNSPSTKFRLGSVTKQFTAACILLLEERGKLKVEDPVKKYMPDAPAAWDKVTIFHLLTHTSGIPSFTSFPDYSQTEPFPTTPEKLVARFRDKPLDFQPGEKWDYSNSGYVLLGYLLEKISGQSYQAFLQENILTPLEMKNTGYDSNSEIIAHRAEGYTPSPKGTVHAGFIHMSIPFSAGSLYSTTEDLLRWEQGLFGGKVLSAASLKKMTTPFKNDYAFGLSVRTENGHKVIDHGGGIEGFNTHLAYYPDDKITVVVLANLNGPASEIAGKLGDVAIGKPIKLTSERKEIPLPAAKLAGYVGTYELTPKVKLMMTLDGDQLMTQLSGQPKLPVYPESETLFFLKVVDAQLEFGKDEKGTYVILHQGGRDQKAPKISDRVEVPKEIAVPHAILERYVGAYELKPQVDITVTLEGDQLMAQVTGQPKFPIFAASDTKFFFKVVDAEIEFSSDQLILHQGGVDVNAKRK